MTVLPTASPAGPRSATSRAALRSPRPPPPSVGAARRSQSRSHRPSLRHGHTAARVTATRHVVSQVPHRHPRVSRPFALLSGHSGVGEAAGEGVGGGTCSGREGGPCGGFGEGVHHPPAGHRVLLRQDHMLRRGRGRVTGRPSGRGTAVHGCGESCVHGCGESCVHGCGESCVPGCGGCALKHPDLHTQAADALPGPVIKHVLSVHLPVDVWNTCA